MIHTIQGLNYLGMFAIAGLQKGVALIHYVTEGFNPRLDVKVTLECRRHGP